MCAEYPTVKLSQANTANARQHAGSFLKMLTKIRKEKGFFTPNPPRGAKNPKTEARSWKLEVGPASSFELQTSSSLNPKP
jgi:hypothetical protein